MTIGKGRMLIEMDTLQTERLVIRPFQMDDLHDINRILNAAFHAAATLDESAAWLRWAVTNYEQVAGLHQPPYGDRAIVLRASRRLIGSVGFVPCLMPFGQLPYFHTNDEAARFTTTEFGLFWAIDPAHHRHGYATEAARAMIAHAFAELHLRRIVATTEYDNIASQGVARKIGMRIERNPLPEPPWLQVVGILENSPT